MPLLHEGRLVGCLSVRPNRGGAVFTDEDVEGLELLAGIAAAAEVGLERAQLVAVTLAARELAHLLNNDLAVPVGALELLREDGSLPRNCARSSSRAGSACSPPPSTYTVFSSWCASRRRRRRSARPDLDLDRSDVTAPSARRFGADAYAQDSAQARLSTFWSAVSVHAPRLQPQQVADRHEAQPTVAQAVDEASTPEHPPTARPHGRCRWRRARPYSSSGR